MRAAGHCKVLKQLDVSVCRCAEKTSDIPTSLIITSFTWRQLTVNGKIVGRDRGAAVLVGAGV